MSNISSGENILNCEGQLRMTKRTEPTKKTQEKRGLNPCATKGNNFLSFMTLSLFYPSPVHKSYSMKGPSCTSFQQITFIHCGRHTGFTCINICWLRLWNKCLTDAKLNIYARWVWKMEVNKSRQKFSVLS